MKAASRLAVSIFLSILLYLTLHKHLWTRRSGPEVRRSVYPAGCSPNERHAIDTRISAAADEHKSILKKSTDDLRDGAASYRARRGRHPPPGFDAWYKYAQQQSSVIVEDFFDQIYRDIEPFWGLEAAEVRASIAAWPMKIKVRNGKVSEVPNKLLRTTVWAEMISQVAAMLPDIDIPLNHLDEARVIASRTVIDKAVHNAAQQRDRMMIQSSESFSSKLSTMTLRKTEELPPTTGQWSRSLGELLQAIEQSCPVNSALSRLERPWTAKASVINEESIGPEFVENMTVAKDICRFPQLTVQHGALVKPATVDFTTTLLPLFTGSKLPLYNDIVIPEPSYYSEKPEFTGKDIWGDWSTYYPWKSKRHSLIWRGSATGGGMNEDIWPFFHRHRLISRLNASETDERVVGSHSAPPEFYVWLRASANAGFTKLYCNDAHNAKICPDLASHYDLVEPVKMASQYQYKYLPDVDGNSVSERFRAFLLSNSAPIKATIFDDWHDHRLIAWRHFIPMHISYRDLYDIMTYFLGFNKTCSHDMEGQAIADNGRDWAQQVLRKDDMVIYMHRVLLEYARVVHDNRDRLGYVTDLLEENT